MPSHVQPVPVSRREVIIDTRSSGSLDIRSWRLIFTVSPSMTIDPSNAATPGSTKIPGRV